MYLYVKTPTINNSNIIAHLIEHCVHNAGISSIEQYFKICDFNPETFYLYTKYNIQDKDYKRFIKNLEQPIDKKIISREYKALKEELREKTFVNKFRFFLNKKIWNKVVNKFNITDVISYHKKYYNKQHYVLADDNYKILKNWIKIENKKEWNFKILNQTQSAIDWEKNFVTILKYSHRKDQVLSDFIWILYDTWAEYNYRYIQWFYHYPYSCVIEWEKYIWIALPLIDKYPKIDFIKHAIEYYCTLIMEWKARENGIINLLHINQLPSQQEMISFIKKIPISVVHNIIWIDNKMN